MLAEEATALTVQGEPVLDLFVPINGSVELRVGGAVASTLPPYQLVGEASLLENLQSKGGEAWLLALREKGRAEVQEALLEFTGVGKKVADCVALFSLDQRDIIPVDVHVWQIAVRDFDPTLVEAKSLTPGVCGRGGGTQK